MKWTNKGHELDGIGERLITVKRVFIWGAGKQGKRMLGLLRWLGVDNDFEITFVDSNKALWGTQVNSVLVTSPQKFFDTFYDVTDVLTTSFESLYHELKKQYGDLLPSRTYIDFAERLPDLDFQRKFLAVWLMYKKGKLLSPHTNYIITTRCNLNCKGCLNFNQYIKHPADETFENFKKHIDIVFSKFDYLSSFHFSGGEVMLHRELPRFLSYIGDTYGDRIYEMFFVANGTIIPSEELLELMKRLNCGVLLDDYSHATPLAEKNFPIIRRLFDEHEIWYNIAKADYWYDLRITNNPNQGADLAECDLIKIHAECGVHYFNDFFGGNIFGCCYIGYTNDMYPNKAGIYTPDPQNDYISIEDSTKMEILEYRSGYLPKGYYELCRRCSEMHGKKSVHIPVAEQTARNFFEEARDN